MAEDSGGDKSQKKRLLQDVFFFGFLIVIILAVMAMGWFLFHTIKESYRSEAKLNMGEIYQLQEKCFKARGHYCESFESLGFKPDRENLYSYYLGQDKIESKRRPGVCNFQPPVTDVGQTFTAYAVGNIDYDSFCEVWSMDSNRLFKCRKVLEDGSIVSGTDMDEDTWKDIFPDW